MFDDWLFHHHFTASTKVVGNNYYKPSIVSVQCKNVNVKYQLYFLNISFVSLTLMGIACRPLPHIRRGGHRLFDPRGNPVYARDLLIYPHDEESCKKGELS